MGTDALVRIIGWALLALARVAPDIVRAFTGGQTAEEAIAAARRKAIEVPVRTGPGGTWTEDLDRRLRRDDGEADPPR